MVIGYKDYLPGCAQPPIQSLERKSKQQLTVLCAEKVNHCSTAVLKGLMPTK